MSTLGTPRWSARHFRAGGPFPTCVLGDGRSSCPLLEGADLAVADLDAPCQPFLRHLSGRHANLPLRFVRGGAAVPTSA